MISALLLHTTLLVSLPAAVFLLFGAGWLLGYKPSERLLSRTTLVSHALLTLIVGWVAFDYWRTDSSAVLVDLGEWFMFHGVGISLSFLIDHLSITLVALTVVLVGLVALFSVRYMHRDPGYFRFFLLLHLFTFGALVVFLASSLDLMFGGWELVGLSSVLLVGFFHYRRDPLRNAVRVFAAYRIADLQIVIATVLAHLWFGSADWDRLLATDVSSSADTWLALLLIIGACGKSAQGPFFGLLARAMEGPTPSSAVFYGAISVHTGAYLLLRIQPLIAGSVTATALLIAFGLITALVAAVMQRTRTDAKTSLAYAAQTQVGLILVEIGLGWTTLALVHIVGHALLRTMQFLRAPSLLHDHHTMHAAAGGHLPATDRLFGSLPQGLRMWLYRLGMGAGLYDAVIDRLVVAPVLFLSRTLAMFDPRSKSRKLAPSIAVLPAQEGEPERGRNR